MVSVVERACNDSVLDFIQRNDFTNSCRILGKMAENKKYIVLKDIRIVLKLLRLSMKMRLQFA